ncbi:DUF6281 family protein [Streptomyces meridianus]|uniref:DUF6281 family protein n=1 Tax=Streptomyces meridianus TaxID=2938945 RepID=A0ABT0X2P4_9ACTN|nr:DUF6281 family protein [Streptomyces meridianus]MCM2576807.1 DUF6281 family protein [Streptomyces meridianus]
MTVALSVRQHVALRAMLVVAAAVASAAGCTVSGGGESAAACAHVVTYEDRKYHGVANIDFTVGEELGTATQPPCYDTGRRTEERATESTAHKVEGLDPDIAIAVGDPDDAHLMVSGANKSLPPEIEKLRDRP